MKPRIVPLSPRGKLFLALFCANLLIGILDLPSLAYEGVFEMIGRAAQSLQPAPPPAPPPSVQLLNNPDDPASPERVAEVQQQLTPSGGISQALADRVTGNHPDPISKQPVPNYVRPQTTEAMHNLLGSPTWQEGNIETYYIAGSSDGVFAGRRLIVTYQDGMATDWYQFGGSIE
jgi:hypothetical protein